MENGSGDIIDDGEGEGEDFEVIYRKSDSYEYVPVTGVRGGRQPRGDLKLEFMLDHYPTPTRDLYRLDQEGAIESHEEEDSPTDLYRDIQFAVNVSPTNSLSIAVFILSILFDVPTEQVQSMIEEEFAEELQEET